MYGELGSTPVDPTTLDGSPVPGLPAVKSVGAGAGTTCALTTGGAVLCWGIGLLLGNGTTSPYTSSGIPQGVFGLS